MSFFQNFKAKRAAKKAKKLFESELAEYNSESELLSRALEIFSDASKGEEPSDQGLVQKAGELVLWTGSAIYHEAGRTPSKYVGGSAGFTVPSLPSSLLTFDLQRKVSLLQKKGLESSPIRYRKIANFYCIGFPPSILFERSNSLS
jgi:hypothetical protein